MEEKAKVWDTITRVLSHREKRGKTCCCGCCRGRQSVLLVDWEDHVFDLIGCFSSDVWCAWLQLITCLMWLRGYHLRNGSTVRSRNKLFKNSPIRILFCFILSSTSTSTTLIFNDFPLNRYGQLELTFCWTQLITGVLFALQACFLGFELAMKFFDWLAPNWWYDMDGNENLNVLTVNSILLYTRAFISWRWKLFFCFHLKQLS